MFIAGLLVGIVIGANVGMICMALFKANRN